MTRSLVSFVGGLGFGTALFRLSVRDDRNRRNPVVTVAHVGSPLPVDPGRGVAEPGVVKRGAGSSPPRRLGPPLDYPGSTPSNRLGRWLMSSGVDKQSTRVAALSRYFERGSNMGSSEEIWRARIVQLEAENANLRSTVDKMSTALDFIGVTVAATGAKFEPVAPAA